MAIIRHIAFFITPHGFGHAARSCAVINALHRLDPRLQFHIFTRVPIWFFEDSLQPGFIYHEEQTDVGLVQTSSLNEDLTATLQALEDLYPLRETQLDRLSGQLLGLGVDLICCDIAPIGLALGHRLGLPSVLIENFTWDWIYTGYLDRAPGLAPFITYHRQVNALAAAHVQALPPCDPTPLADLTVRPISRRPRRSPETVRQNLGIPPEKTAVLVTMGGVQEKYDLMGRFKAFPEKIFILPGPNDQLIMEGNIIRLPYHSAFYHPDLVNAADVVVGKTGYSTVAEISHADVPFGYINRANFREAEIMSAFIQMTLPAFEISQADFFNGTWIEDLPSVSRQRKTTRSRPNGADQVAQFLLKRFSNRPSG
jgi:hypothetical protein